MSVQQQRRERERADRHRLIVKAARELAEAEGWAAVTTRRLSEAVAYSQPVLYSHFKGKDAIVAAVATDGFEELTGALRAARTGAGADPAAALAALADAYLDFAGAHPALYEAMFVRRSALEFATENTPEALRTAFAEFLLTVGPLAGGRDTDTLAELTWSALHGLATLDRTDRLRPDLAEGRLELLVDAVVSGGR
ncbi:TetR/AcrR family transcriptional regulator [Streptomyces sp. NPDC015346]|uniref:TetR/AcrR family transcriptional regulator n=1 Tax=Streptomyces sp. NPDC015346 TaxID=3364954 RepID=UPI0036F9618F